jgi:hypothetical protein
MLTFQISFQFIALCFQNGLRRLMLHRVYIGSKQYFVRLMDMETWVLARLL